MTRNLSHPYWVDARQPRSIPHAILKSPPGSEHRTFTPLYQGPWMEVGFLCLWKWWWKWICPAENILTHNPWSKMQTFRSPVMGPNWRIRPFLCEESPSMSLSCHGQGPRTPVDLATGVFTSPSGSISGMKEERNRRMHVSTQQVTSSCYWGRPCVDGHCRWSQAAENHIPFLLGLGSSGKLFHFSLPPNPHLQNEDHSNTYQKNFEDLIICCM